VRAAVKRKAPPTRCGAAGHQPPRPERVNLAEGFPVVIRGPDRHVIGQARDPEPGVPVNRVRGRRIGPAVKRAAVTRARLRFVFQRPVCEAALELAYYSRLPDGHAHRGNLVSSRRFMMLRSDAPAIAALVACPARRECPAYFAESSPARSASFFTTRATSPPDRPHKAATGKGGAPRAKAQSTGDRKRSDVSTLAEMPTRSTAS
jgi:hypothetical protein